MPQAVQHRHGNFGHLGIGRQPRQRCKRVDTGRVQFTDMGLKRIRNLAQMVIRLPLRIAQVTPATLITMITG